MSDLNALTADEISVKLRNAETNAKVSRTPANIEAAIEALAIELLDLYGPEGLYHVTGAIAAAYARDKEMPATSSSVVSCATELLVNMYLVDKLSGENIATQVVSELSDMELIA